ncbi:MAG: hypothetical protein ACRDDW_05730 [Candidatus Rhabdochlamydia sp.]
MIGNANFNPTQSVSSYLKSIGLSFSNKDQMVAKVKALALAIIPLILVSGLSLASAQSLISTEYGCQQYCNSQCGSYFNNCFKSCMQRDCPK